MTQALWPWAAFALLGAYHGINPGMGWLFAVARGLQQQTRRAVLTSLLPIAAGHEASIVAAVLAVAFTEHVVPPHTVRLLAALTLVGFGVYTLARPRRHPRGSGMRVGAAGLAWWSFLMASAHGAGLMLAPVLLGMPVADQYSDLRSLTGTAFAAAGIHVVTMLAVMALVSVLVYEKLGLGFLRRSWFNLDLAWSGALLLSGTVTLVTA
ncbi:MAG: hypothetical protein E6I08_05865 [Chloroflexi bacterium]|nr:MAG: hypothetical protein E6I08_05865 [Chloroflexota bacterium]